MHCAFKKKGYSQKEVRKLEMNWDIVAFKRKPVTLTCTDKEKKILSNLCQRVEKLGGKRNS